MTSALTRSLLSFGDHSSAAHLLRLGPDMNHDDETEIRLDARHADERCTLRRVLGINFTQVQVAGAAGILVDSTGLLGLPSTI